MTELIGVPCISEEPVASVLNVLTLIPDENHSDRFTGHSLPMVQRVYGGQIVAQGLLASASTIDDQQRLPHSLHSYFLLGADPTIPLTFSVRRVHDGHSFAQRQLACDQGGPEIFTMTSSYQKPEEGLSYSVSAPSAPDPHTLESAIDLLRAVNNPVGKFLGETSAFDIRHVGTDLYTQPAEPTCPEQQLWMKLRVSEPIAASQSVHRALLAYGIDQIMFEPALRTSSLAWNTPGLRVASIDHSMWFHHDVNINDWLLYCGSTSMIHSGRMLSHVRVFSQAGALVAEASQQGMLRIAHQETQGSRWGLEGTPEKAPLRV